MDKKLVRLSCCLIFASCLVLVCLLAGCGEEKVESQMQLTLTPVELSEDARLLAKALGYQGAVQAFEYRLEGAEADGGQSLSLDIWLYEDGRWLKQTGTMLELQQEDKLLLVNGDDGFWAIAGERLNQGGGYHCVTDIWSRTPSAHDSWWHFSISEPVTLLSGEECFLRALTPPDDNTPEFDENSVKDFREVLAIEEGVVLTATFNAAE